jgi:transglutaminase-like putative cysteine protease
VRLAIQHLTRYVFEEPVAHGLQRLRLTPKSSSGQKVIAWRTTIEGGRCEAEYDDHNHNRTTLISVAPGTRELAVTCEGVVDTADQLGMIGRHAGYLSLWHFLDPTPATVPGPRIKALLAAVELGNRDVSMLHRLSAAILDQVAYVVGVTDAGTSAEDAVAAGKGVCQDHAHVFVACARAIGIPARYVSGYLKMTDRVEQEAGHAWAEAYLDGLGWVGFDVSNGISPDQRYVRVATGRDYGEAAPVTGISYGGGGHAMHVSLAVEQQPVGE